MVVISEYFLSLNQWILRQKPFIMKFVGLRLTKNKKVHFWEDILFMTENLDNQEQGMKHDISNKKLCIDDRVSENIQFLGVIMTCFMVFYHCGDYGNPESIGLNKFLNDVFSSMGTYVMCHFFTITGFLLFYNLSFKNIYSKIRRRVSSLLIPYIAWQTIIAIMISCLSRTLMNPKEFLVKTFGCVQWPLDGALWYCYAVFIIALFSPVLLWLFKNKKTAFVITIILVIGIEARTFITASLFVNIVNYGYLPNILFYLPCYLVGAYIGKFCKELEIVDVTKSVFIIAFAAFVLQSVFTGFFANTVIKLLPIVSIFVISKVPQLGKMKILYHLTFLMYAIHQPVIGEFKWRIDAIIGKCSIPVSVQNLLARIIILAIDVLISYSIFALLHKHFPRGIKVLTGGRG